MSDDTDLIVERTITGNADASKEHRQSASMFLCWPCNMLDVAKDDKRLPDLVEELAKVFACWERRGEARLRSELEQATAEWLNRLADATRDLEKDKAAKDARIAEQTSAAIGLAAVIEMERARAEQAEAQLAAKAIDLKAANDAADIWFGKAKNMEEALEKIARGGFLYSGAPLDIARATLAQATDQPADARLTSLEKSVTMLRAENVELREIASGLSYYADGHGLQEKWAAELRSLNQRLGALIDEKRFYMRQCEDCGMFNPPTPRR